MRKIIFLVFVVLLLPDFVFSQNQAITRILPRFAAGSLPNSEWETTISIFNATSEPNSVLVELFDNSGRPAVLATSKGVGEKFVLNFGGNGSDSVVILRQNGFASGWAKTTSFTPHDSSLSFSQFANGALVGEATVSSSPTRNVIPFPLNAENGIALVNPGSQDTTVNFTAFNNSGQKINEGSFVLARGAHFAGFFREAPFFLNHGEGKIVFASNIPIAGIGLGFNGLVFRTLPPLSTPRILDSPRNGTKIGFLYLNSNDRQPMQKAELQKYLAEAVHFQNVLLDRGLPLNGHDPVELPYDLEDNGLPKVVMVQGGSQELYSFKNRSWDAINQIERDAQGDIPSNWKYVVYIPDVWKSDDDISGVGGGGVALVSVQYFRYMDRAFLGDNSSCALVLGKTKSDCANTSFSHFNHEVGHALWDLEHSAFSDDSSTILTDQMKYRSMMGRASGDGCFNSQQIGKGECALLPVEAEGVARGFVSRVQDFDWILRDESHPLVEVISKEITSDFRLKVVFKAEDLESGINSIAINTEQASPWTQYWKQIGHQDDLSDLVIETNIKPQKAGNQLGPIYLLVKNNQGGATKIRIF